MSFFGASRHPGATPLPVEGRLPGFDRATGWLNSPPLGRDDLAGKVVLADFWTYTCINWLRTLAWVRASYEKYGGLSLVVVGVHTPEFWFEHDVDEIRRAAEEMRVEYPIAVDSDYGVWQDFGNRYWPAVYIADAEGRIRYHHFGEGDYAESERAIQMLLREAGVDGVEDSLVSVDPDGFEVQADWANLGS
ncbi:MAG TPA: redoxin domain-containing protein, partial [Gaiellaceae bacterium]|nr:redoxin domain-containing protein [Gaiellaceae bacterium]